MGRTQIGFDPQSSSLFQRAVSALEGVAARATTIDGRRWNVIIVGGGGEGDEIRVQFSDADFFSTEDAVKTIRVAHLEIL